jgi:uridylate kinase
LVSSRSPPYFFDPLAAYFRKLTFFCVIGGGAVLRGLTATDRRDSLRTVIDDSGVLADLPATSGL